MRRHEFPIVTFVSLLVLTLVTAWQVHRALEFSERLKSVNELKERPFAGKEVRRVELPALGEKPKPVCITVFRPPTLQQRSSIFASDFILPPRPKFTLLRSDEKGVELQLNRDGAKVVGLRLGGYFQFQGERYHLIDVRTNRVILRQASNHRRLQAYAATDPAASREHHL